MAHLEPGGRRLSGMSSTAEVRTKAGSQSSEAERANQARSSGQPGFEPRSERVPEHPLGSALGCVKCSAWRRVTIPRCVLLVHLPLGGSLSGESGSLSSGTCLTTHVRSLHTLAWHFVAIWASRALIHPY